MRALGLLVVMASLVGPIRGAAGGPLRVELSEHVTVDHDRVTVRDLSRHPVPAPWGDVVVLRLSTPGREVTISRARMRRVLGAYGGNMPRLTGADPVRVRLAGQPLSDARFRAALQPLLDQIPRPPETIDQRWEIRRVPATRLADGPLTLRLLNTGPVVGPGQVSVEVVDHRQTTQRLYVGVDRTLQVSALRTTSELGRGTQLSLANALPSPRWVERPGDLASSVSAAALQRGVKSVRNLPAGTWVAHRDIRDVPEVERGSRVEWIVLRGGLQVSMQVEARGEGRTGDWIYVKTPFGGALKRAQILGPGRVGDAAINHSTEGTPQ